MRKIYLTLIFVLTVLSCQYDSNSQNKDKEVKNLAIKAFNISTPLVRVNSSIAWEWKDSSGFLHQMSAGDFAIDNSKGNGIIQVTDSSSVIVEPCADYYEKKNSDSVVMEVDKSLGSAMNRAIFDVNYGTPAYLELFEPVLISIVTSNTYLFMLDLYVASGTMQNIFSTNVNAINQCGIIPKGKYRLFKQTSGMGNVLIIPLSKKDISTLYTVTTVNPGW